MKIKAWQKFAALLAITGCAGASVWGGTFKTITIDGSFADWAGVPVAYSQPQDSTTSVAYQSISLANDNDYLYLRLTIYPPAGNPFTYLENLFVDTDDNAATGYLPFFGAAQYTGVGSEILIQGGAGYQQKNGGFNEAVVNGLNWSAAPAAPATEFEARISRQATFASDGSAVFTNGNDTIVLAFEAEDTNGVAAEFFPTNGSGGLVYTFASAAGPVTITDPSQPLSESVSAGSPVTFTVAADGGTPLFYHWFRGNGLIAGATTSSYTLASAQVSDSGATFYCQVTNSVSATNSRTAALTVNAAGGNTFRTITIDGSFSDWAGISAYTQANDNPSGAIAYQNIYVANDANYLYLRISIYGSAADIFTTAQNILIDTDTNSTTGFVYYKDNATAYSGFGSDMFIQQGAGYEGVSGNYNAGGVNGVDWMSAPAAPATEYEVRISRSATFANSGSPVFTNNTISIALEAEDSGFVAREFAPTNGSGGLVYTFAAGTSHLGPLAISLTGGNISITWPGAGTLQSSSSLSSPNWADVVGAVNPVVSPYNVSPAGGRLFFRLKQ